MDRRYDPTIMTCPARFIRNLLLLACGTLTAAPATGTEADDFFEKRIRPVLVERCQKCHGQTESKGKLRLDSRESLLQGGETGGAVVIGKPDQSLLIQAIRHQNGLAMPPDGKLSEVQIADFVTWIKSGAAWPGSKPTGAIPQPPQMPIAISPNDGDLSKSLQLWLRADSLLLADGDTVSVWPDKSGRGRDVAATKGVRTDGTGLPGKFIQQSSLLKRPAVRFETTTGYAASPDHPVDIRGDAALTIMLVMNLQPHEVQPPYDGVIGIGNPANPGGDPGRPLAALIQINRGEDHALHFAGGWNHDASAGPASFKPLYGKPVILTAIKQPGPMRTSTRLFINGEPIRASADGLAGRDTVPDIQHRTDIGTYLGKAVSWAGSIQGDLGEVLVYNKAITEAERTGVEGHLADKFGLTIPHLANLAPKPVFTDDEKSYWAYQPIRDVNPPTLPNESGIKSPIDRFIRSKLNELKIEPAPVADKVTLLRRVTFDLTGLPPSPDEVKAFLADESPQAFETVVNRLLDSPHYGERWARHWLDVVRYAESTANDANAVMRFAWRYRNYVIDAFNSDLPYDQFLMEQLAGDLMPATESAETTSRRIIATGYLMIGPKALAETDKEQSRLDIVDDQIDVTSRAMLGLTVSCARCHDHKFDAIRTTDYYALAGIFRSTEPFQNENRNATMWWEYPVPQGPGKDPIVVMAPKEALPRNLKVHLRGNRFTLGATVPRGVIQIADQIEPRFDAMNPGITSSGRLELARWIANPRNPLTSRVMVNRIWQHHFGRGLVATSDNFGTRGDRPSHPELLDWLASRFVESGWSVKSMHRQILLSNTYQQGTVVSEDARLRDPDGRWLASFPRRRLSAEELRDAMLAVSGKLDRTSGSNESGEYLVSKAENIGAMIMPNRMAADDPFYTTFAKRSIYLPIVRNMLPDVLALFDAADPNGVSAVRNETTVASQSLFLLNSPFVRDQAARFAQGLLASQTSSDVAMIQSAHQSAFGRTATPEEIEQAQQFLSDYQNAPANQSRSEAERRLAAWTSYCQSLICSNEFLYLD